MSVSPQGLLPGNMAFIIDKARPEDLAEFISVIVRSHQGKDHYINCAYPDNLSSEGQAQALKKLQDSTSSAEDSQWEKATDAATGRIVGAAIWATFLTQKPTDNATSDTNEQNSSPNEEYVKELNSSIAKAESDFWEDNALPLTSLAVLAVAPEYQRQGVGTQLMKSGFAQADRIGAKISVVSTDAAGSFYEKCGFRVENHLALEVSEQFSTEEKVWIYFLIRDRADGS